MSESKNKKNLSRREFIGGAVVGAAALAGFTGCNAFPTIVPRHVLGGPHFVPPSEMVRIAKVGCSNMGQQDLDGIKAAGENQIVALCDVDWDKAAPAFKEYPKAKQFKDFRVMLDEMGDSIDAVMVSTPDHNHAVISMAAIKQGKHVFCQKPLTHNIYEARMLTEAAKKYGVATLMGIQGHSFEGIRLMDEWINHYKVIGKVSEVHIWTDRLGWNHQWHGNLPTDLPPVPKNMDWDTWIGPATPRPFSPSYHPNGWRAFWNFGCGAIGDMACHLMDASFHVLKLGYPTRVSAQVSDRSDHVTPVWSIITYEFPARGEMPPVKLVWYDGGKKPEPPAGFEPGRKLEDNGQYFVGEHGVILGGTYGENPRIVPTAKMREFNATKPAKILERSPGHYQEWIRACKGGKAAGASFAYSGPLTEVVHLGNVAIRAGQPIEFDPKKIKITNCAEANQYLKREYRKGWSL